MGSLYVGLELRASFIALHTCSELKANVCVLANSDRIIIASFDVIDFMPVSILAGATILYAIRIANLSLQR